MSKGKSVSIFHSVGQVSTSRSYTNMDLDEVVAHEIALGNKEVAPLVISGGRIDVQSMAEAVAKSGWRVEVLGAPDVVSDGHSAPSDDDLRSRLDRMVQEAAGADADRRKAVVTEVLKYLEGGYEWDVVDRVYRCSDGVTAKTLHDNAVAIVDLVLPRV